MANHKSSIKRIRQADKKKLHNRYYAKTARNAVRNLRATADKTVANEMLLPIAGANIRPFFELTKPFE